VLKLKLARFLFLPAIFFSLNAVAGSQLHLMVGTLETGHTESVSIQNLSASPYKIIQFKNTITQADKNRLAAAGFEVIRYVPDDAYLVKAVGGPEGFTGLKGLSGLRTIVDYAPDFKVSPLFGVIDTVNGHVPEKVLIKTFNEDATRTVQRFLDGKATVKFASGKTVGAVLPLQVAKQLSEIEGVEWVEPYPDFKFQNFEVSSEVLQSVAEEDIADLDGGESGTRLMNFEAAWGRGLTGKDQIVGFADTGLDSGDIATLHPDFQGQVKKGVHYGGLLPIPIFQSWADPMGHGTHVAGSIAGNGASSGGMTQGGAYEAQLIAGGMWDSLLNNMIPPQDITQMFKEAYEEGARIHTNSWGSPRDLGSYDQFAATVDEYMWENPDMLVMFAAGNSGVDANKDGRVDNDSIGSPATAKNVLSVGASENVVGSGGIQRTLGELKNQQGEPLFSEEPIASDTLSDDGGGIAAFSSRGPTDDLRTKPDLVAPGTNILSVRSQEEDASELWGAYNKDYSWSGGTSMSTPLVAGGAAVVRQYLIRDQKISNPSAALVKGFLMHTATDLFPGQFGEVGADSGQELLERRPNQHQGFGRVDMDLATNFDGEIFSGKVGPGDSVSTTVSGYTGAKITVIYTDAPSAASSQKTLVNNLDLEVYEGGTLISSGVDSINNYEYLEVTSETGDLEIRVIGQNIPTARADGTLPYELIVSPM